MILLIFNLLEGVCPSHYFAVFCSTQSTLSATQGGYGEQGFQTSRGYQSQHDVNELQPSTYATYQSTVYQPFTTAVPSDDNPVAGFGSEPQITNRKNGFLNPADPDEENRADGSPIGEPWILLLFAAVAAAVVAWRQRRAVLRG